MVPLSPHETRAALSYVRVAAAIRDVLRAKRAGTACAPVRQHIPLANGGVLLLMPASDETLAIAKLVTVHPENGSLGLPSVQAELVVLESYTGRRLAILDGATVTAVRTAALSLLAAQRLAPHPGGDLLIVGAGIQAEAHLEAFAEGLDTPRIFIFSRNAQRAEGLAARGRKLGVDVRAIAEVRAVLDTVRLIVTVTTSSTPVIPGDVAKGTFIAAIGAYQPNMAELPAELVLRSTRPESLLVVDTLEGARAEGGDLIQAGVDWDRVVPLESIIDDPANASDVVAFKSVGSALWDLAAAHVAVRKAGVSDAK